MKMGTLYHGFGGFDIGAERVGLVPTWGIEWDNDLADVARQNLGGHIVTADVTAADPTDYELVDWLHSSPPCPNFSVAKADALEKSSDLAHAKATARFIEYHQPLVFTLENVVQYRHSKSMDIIRQALSRYGYLWDEQNVCASVAEVPQTRNRLIVRGSKNLLPPYLIKKFKPKCWYESIDDLVSELDESEFANWQLGFLNHARARGVKSFVMTGSNARNSIGYRELGQPAFTVTASQKANTRAKLPNGRVVSLNPLCLARWQSFPDWYELPPKKTLACRGIGNAVPPLLSEYICKPLFDSFN